MKFILFIQFFVIIHAAAQTDLTISGRTYNNSADTWEGVDIARTSPARLIFTNNTISSRNRFGYLLQAGDEAPASTNNNLDGAVITGNRLNWSGSDMKVIPHGIFTGHNSNVIIKYNYLNHVPMGIIRKSGNNMSNTGGGVAYNIVKGGAVAMVVKGMSNVNIFNNTFYGDRTPAQTWRPLLYIYTNTDQELYSVAHGTKVYNNIFYTRYRTPAITVLDQESLTGFECDYNVYWCETGTPLFRIGEQDLTFEQWQARGYDLHSVVMDPKFRDLVGFVPNNRLDFGRDLGAAWAQGLAVGAKWGTTDPATTLQNGPWQAGAVIHGTNDGQPPAPGSQIKIYPNPVMRFFNISIEGAGQLPQTIRIYDLAGKLRFEYNSSAELLSSVPVNLTAGIYLLYIRNGSQTEYSEKLIVIE